MVCSSAFVTSANFFKGADGMQETNWARPDWYDDANCRDLPPEIFFPEAKDWAPARRVCEGCPVREECLEFALSNDEKHGIWGGYGARARRRMRREREKEESNDHSSG